MDHVENGNQQHSHQQIYTQSVKVMLQRDYIGSATRKAVAAT